MTSQSNYAEERRGAQEPDPMAWNKAIRKLFGRSEEISEERKPMLKQTIHCSSCGMTKNSPTEFHPAAACALFEHLKNSPLVEANIRFVVEYGMKAQKHGLSLDQAMNDITALTVEPQERK